MVQGDAFNASTLRAVLCVVLTSNVKWAEAPANVLLAAKATGLPKPSVANVSQLVTFDRGALTERAGRLSASGLELVLAGSTSSSGGADDSPPPVAATCYEDHSPRPVATEVRPGIMAVRGEGRPSKRLRRALERLRRAADA